MIAIIKPVTHLTILYAGDRRRSQGVPGAAIAISL